MLPVRHDTPPGDIIALNAPALSQLGVNEERGIQQGEYIFRAITKSMLGFIGIQTWENEDIWDFANLAYSEYYWLNMAELKQFMQKVKLGKFESNKNVTPVILMGFLTKYAEEMLVHRYNHFSQQKPKAKTRSFRDRFGVVYEIPIDEVVILPIDKITKNKIFALKMCKYLQIEHDKLLQEALLNISKMDIAKNPYTEQERGFTDFKKTIQEAKSTWDTSAVKQNKK